MSKQTLVLIIILFLFTAGLLGLALNKSSYSPKASLPLNLISPAPTKNPVATSDVVTPDTSLLFGDLQVALASESAIVTSNVITTTHQYLLPIIINTGVNKVTTVQLELSYDPDILKKVNINPSSFFENPTILINQIDSKSRRISYALGMMPSASESAESLASPGKQGEGTLAILTFQTIKGFIQINTAITFLPKTFVVAEGLEESALRSTNSAQLTINP